MQNCPYLEYQSELGCFILWPNSLLYLRGILKEINASFPIVRIIRINPSSLDKLIRQAYPFSIKSYLHIRAKSAYLHSLKHTCESFLVFISDNKPEHDALMSAANHIKCMNRKINVFKWKIRDKYNNRCLDTTLNHDHVIHGCDNSAEALKLWSFYEPDKAYSAICMPNTRSQIDSTTSNIINIDPFRLRAAICYGNSWNSNIHHIELSQTPHYLFLKGLTTPYLNYINKFRGTRHKCYYSEERYSELIENYFNQNRPIDAKLYKGKLVILDGLHRACIHYARNDAISVRISA